MNFENFENDRDLREYLFFFTGHLYSFAESSLRIWGKGGEVEGSKYDPAKSTFYQLMPDEIDDGFFNYYVSIRPDNQFFKTKEMCVIHFVRFWTDWSRKGKPSFDTQ